MRPTSHPGGHLFTEVKRTYPGHCSWSLDDPNKLTLNHRSHDHLAGIYSDPPGAVGGDRLLHGGGAHAARAVDLLRTNFLTIRGHSTSATTRAGLASPPLIFKGSATSKNLFVPICERLVTN